VSKKKFELDLSARAQEQIQELKSWLGEADAARAIELAISRAWRSVYERQYGHLGAPWVVRPGPHRFDNEAAAVRWLGEQGAQPVSLNMWAAEGADGELRVWELEPLRDQQDRP
jgi:hypothetical protein